MKFLLIILGITAGTVLGLYTRPSFFMIGQLNWVNVLTKGYFVGSFEGLFTQAMLDESFLHVLKFQGIGLVIAILLVLIMSIVGKSKAPKKAKK